MNVRKKKTIRHRGERPGPLTEVVAAIRKGKSSSKAHGRMLSYGDMNWKWNIKVKGGSQRWRKELKALL